MQRQLPWIHDTQVIALAFPAEGARNLPGLPDELEGLLEALAVMGWVGVGRKLLDAGVTQAAGNYAPPLI